VIAGALGAHTGDPAVAETVATAERYQMWHALALLAVAWLAATPGARFARVAGCLFAAGIVLFSGSLYVWTATGWQGVTLATPVGGLAFVLGWLDLALAGYRAVRSAGGDRPRGEASPPPPRS
jgi:uncharacterized membrane protein YgdD (TMEM256/DUF423 family)